MAAAALRTLTAYTPPLPSDIPRSIALPAATASLAYLNAKYGLTLDARTIYLLISYASHTAAREKADRVNAFYAFERWATDPQTRDRVFLVTPHDPAAQHPRPQREWTYAEAYGIVGKYARWLREVHGVQKGEIVAMDFTNREG
ncbi:long-chain fatty acid transporter fat1, partial [Friedmanniomyces endolithicus]